MVPITFDEFSQIYIDWNPEEKLDEVRSRCEAALRQKFDGVKCQVCGASSIWALGSVLSGFDVCFTCITGEMDDSGDFEFVL